MKRSICTIRKFIFRWLIGMFGATFTNLHLNISQEQNTVYFDDHLSVWEYYRQWLSLFYYEYWKSL